MDATAAVYAIKTTLDQVVKGVCYNLTAAMADLLEREGVFRDPSSAPEPHTNVVKCTTGGDASLVHGAQSYCGWVTGGGLLNSKAKLRGGMPCGKLDGHNDTRW